MQPNSNPNHATEDLAAYAVIGVALVVGLLWTAGIASAFVCGHRIPRGNPVGAVFALAHFGDPSAAWHAPVGPAWVYWTLTVLLMIAAAGVVLVVRHVFTTTRTDRSAKTLPEGFATRREIKRAAGADSLTRRGRTLRPSLPGATTSDLGYRLGRS
ncbi:MAG: hypothetical protein M3Y35_04535, partial [Actinomycetota bacterium]|nr:hypothetical protein [Actinomycetota bacterium]